jgi:hypothetical protein
VLEGACYDSDITWHLVCYTPIQNYTPIQKSVACESFSREKARFRSPVLRVTIRVTTSAIRVTIRVTSVACESFSLEKARFRIHPHEKARFRSPVLRVKVSRVRLGFSVASYENI